MGDTSRSQTISTKLQRIAEQAVQYPETVFTTLAHHIDVEFLREAYRRTRKAAAPGVDGVTAKEYAGDLDANLQALHERLRSGRYKAPPVKRVWLDKEDGRKRPIGLPAFEDKIVQRSVTMILEAIYEQDFQDCSYGFRPGRSAHQALHEIRERCMGKNIGWIVDADVSGYFDNIDHGLLREMLRRRVNDGGLLRLIGKWLHAGVLEGETLTYPEKGSPQGGVISPMLANIFLHHVLDEWFECEIKPRLKGRSFLIRFADDFIIGCELETDARGVMDVLPKRFTRFGLTIHPEKTTLVEFRRPGPGNGSGSGPGTFDFLGLTHYWAKSRRGNWVITRKTMGKRLRRAMKSLWQWCRAHRHSPLEEQHRELCTKLRGHYQYYGVRGNYALLARVYRFVEKAWRYWLSRRSRQRILSWEKYQKLCRKFPLPRPRIVHAL